MARLRLGADEAVLGVRGSEIAGRIVMLDELWGGAEARRFGERLARARDGVELAAIVDDAIAARLARAHLPSLPSRVALEAAAKLTQARVSDVAGELGVSERHLRRLFRDRIGMSPKAFARLARFHRALRAARGADNWAAIAAEAGYYDQAHLIAEFRAIAGVTPSALVAELGAHTPTAQIEPPRR